MGCKQIARLITAVCGIAVAALFSACSFSDDFVAADDTPATDEGNAAYVKFGFLSPGGTSSLTRSNPNGGEDGDGHEKGQDYENKISSAAVFLYHDFTGVNGNAATPVTMLTFTSNQLTAQTKTGEYDYIAVTDATEVNLTENEYHVIAVANPSATFLSWAKSKGSLTLGDVRDYIETSAWTQTVSSTDTTYSDFLMSSENDDNVLTLTRRGKAQPDTAKVEVERMAARVDCSGIGGEFSVEDENYSDATVNITGAAIVNRLTSGSYLLKRVSAGKGRPLIYLGEETDDNYVSTNYVIDPWTDSKDGTEVEEIDGLTYDAYYPGYALDTQQDPSYWQNLMTSGTAIDDTCRRIGYTMENTTYADYTSKIYSTGVVFSAVFHPATTSVKGNYTDGATFFKWDGVLYATAEDMMKTAYPNSFTDENHFVSQITGTWEDISMFAATLADDDPTGYKAYLLEQAEGKEGADELTGSDISSLKWDTYMETVCGYKCVDGTVTLNAFNDPDTSEYASTRAALADRTSGAVSTYEDGRCYYTWWLRHSNDDSDLTNGVMEYSVVRNNIYKLTVKSVYSLGGDIPTEGIRILVKVNNWTMLDKETLDM